MSNHEPDNQVPPRLAETLREAYHAEAPTMDLDLDQPTPARSLKRHWLQRHGAMAAAIVLGLSLALVMLTQTPLDPMDLNADGRIDVLDALALSNSIDRQAALADLNADGFADRRDVEVVMDRIVRLEGSAG